MCTHFTNTLGSKEVIHLSSTLKDAEVFPRPKIKFVLKGLCKCGKAAVQKDETLVIMTHEILLSINLL